MKITITNPTKAYLTDYSYDELLDLKSFLTYENTSVKFLIGKHSKNHFWKQRNIESWSAHMSTLKKDLRKCLVFEDDNGFYIRPGSIPYLTGFNAEVVNLVKYPTPKKMAWNHPLPFKLHPEQEDSWQKLIAEKHANVSLCTGFGKSAIIIKLARELGLKTCIVVPAKSIFLELLEKLEYHLGKGKVGTYGAGKKKLGKNITVCIGDSLCNIKPGSEEEAFFKGLDVMIIDESHTTPSETLEAVCHGILSDIPYRVFLSATQIRGDGTAPLLQSIIGKTVCELGTQEAVVKGYICPHEYRIINVESSAPNTGPSDPLSQKRDHFLNNTNIAQFIARLANASALQGKQTLVLCEELSQLSMLVPMLTTTYALAHSEKNAERLSELGLEKVDVSESIEKFNKNEAKVLITTSCCHVGVNLFPTHNTAGWIGSASEIKTRQATIGRSVRHGHSNPWASKCLPKEKAIIFDFNVWDNPTLERHLEARLECYRDSGPGLIKFITLKK